jgi:hypothetical protein
MHDLPLRLRILNFFVRTIGAPFQFFYRVFLGRWVNNNEIRRGHCFVIEIEKELGPLLHKYGGKVSIVWTKIIPAPFGYLMATAVFPDGKLTFVRGRSEFYVTLDKLGQAITIFSASMPNGSGDKGRDGGALERSVDFLGRHWNTLLGASSEELYQLNMQSR